MVILRDDSLDQISCYLAGFEISLWTYGAKRAHKLMSVAGLLRRVVVALGSDALVGSFFRMYAGSWGASGPATVTPFSLESDLTSASFTVPTTAPSTTPTTQPTSSSFSSSSTTSTTQPVAMTTIQSSPPTSQRHRRSHLRPFHRVLPEQVLAMRQYRLTTVSY